MIVIYKPKNCVPQRLGNIIFDSVELKPGANMLTDKDYGRLSKHPDFEKYKTLKALVVQEPKEEVEPVPLTSIPQNLSGYNVEEAEDIIDNTHDVDVLQRWLTAETRKTTRTDLERRIKDIQEGNN